MQASPKTALLIASTLFAALWGGLLAAMHLDGSGAVLDRIEAPLTDLRLMITGPRAPPGDVVIVALDDDAVEAAGAYPLPREIVAKLVRAIAKAGPKALGVDLLFLDHGSPQGDAALAASLRESHAIIAAAGFFSGSGGGTLSGKSSPLPFAERVLLPIPLFRDAAAIGLVNVAADQAGTPRHVPLLVGTRNGVIPSFALRVAAAAAGVDPVFEGDRLTIGKVMVPTDSTRSLVLRFYGPRGTLRTIGAQQILTGKVDDKELRDRIVVIGATAIGTGDTFATPFDPVFPGVETLATAIAQLATGEALARNDAVRRVDAAAAVLLPVFTVLLIGLRHIGLGLAVTAIVIAGWSAIAVVAYAKGIWLNMAIPLAALVPAVMVHMAARLWLDRRTERGLVRAQDNLRRFHPPALASVLAQAPDFLSEPVEQDAAILFIDLSGFTGLSEKLGPTRTRALLKEFHTLVDGVVSRHGGLVLSFMGDGAMIVFGLPKVGKDDPARAVASACALAVEVRRWIDGLPVAPFGVRIGAHFGPVVVSRLGAESHQHITASGDSVNVTSRLLEVGKKLGAAVTFSEDLLRNVDKLPSNLSETQDVEIRGRSRPLAVRFLRPEAIVAAES